MNCMPPCVRCTGLCKQVVSSAPDSGPVPDARGHARVQGAGYWIMTCLHYTTPEEQRAVRPFRAARHKAWCTQCNKWQRLVRHPDQKRTVETEPLF